MEPSRFRMPRFALVTLVLAYLGPGLAPEATNARRQRSLRSTGDEAAMNVDGLLSGTIGVVLSVLAVILAVIIIGALFSLYVNSAGNITENFTNADWGNDTANQISPVIAILLSLAFMLAIVGVVFAAISFRKRG